jgi:hypothetical protein
MVLVQLATFVPEGLVRPSHVLREPTPQHLIILGLKIAFLVLVVSSVLHLEYQSQLRVAFLDIIVLLGQQTLLEIALSSVPPVTTARWDRQCRRLVLQEHTRMSRVMTHADHALLAIIVNFGQLYPCNVPQVIIAQNQLPFELLIHVPRGHTAMVQICVRRKSAICAHLVAIVRPSALYTYQGIAKLATIVAEVQQCQLLHQALLEQFTATMAIHASR